MKIVLLSFVILMGGDLGAADVFSQNGTDPGNPGMCLFDDELFAPGEYKLQKRCVKIICGSNGWISGHSCVIQKVDGCKPSELSGIKRPFPDCCKRLYRCHNEEYGDFTIEAF